VEFELLKLGLLLYCWEWK